MEQYATSGVGSGKRGQLRRKDFRSLAASSTPKTGFSIALTSRYSLRRDRPVRHQTLFALGPDHWQVTATKCRWRPRVEAPKPDHRRPGMMIMDQEKMSRKTPRHSKRAGVKVHSGLNDVAPPAIGPGHRQATSQHLTAGSRAGTKREIELGIWAIDRRRRVAPVGAGWTTCAGCGGRYPELGPRRSRHPPARLRVGLSNIPRIIGRIGAMRHGQPSTSGSVPGGGAPRAGRTRLAIQLAEGRDQTLEHPAWPTGDQTVCL